MRLRSGVGSGCKRLRSDDTLSRRARALAGRKECYRHLPRPSSSPEFLLPAFPARTQISLVGSKTTLRLVARLNQRGHTAPRLLLLARKTTSSLGCHARMIVERIRGLHCDGNTG